MSERTPEQLAELFRDVFFVDVRGRACLELLEGRYCVEAAVVTEGGIDAVLKTYQRAAHREVLDFIHMMIGRAPSEAKPQSEAVASFAQD